MIRDFFSRTLFTHSDGALVTMPFGLFRQDLNDWARLGSVTAVEALQKI